MKGGLEFTDNSGSDRLMSLLASFSKELLLDILNLDLWGYLVSSCYAFQSMLDSVVPTAFRSLESVSLHY